MKYTYLHINSTQQELHVDVCKKIWTYTAENPQLNPIYIPHEMHILAHYFHTARITCGCMWKSLNMTAKNPQSNPVWPYIPHEMHMLAHYFHTTTGAPNSAKFRGGCRFDKGGGLQKKLNFYAIKISTF